MYHIKIEAQPWNNVYVVRLMDASVFVRHETAPITADEVELEAMGKKLYEEQTAEDMRDKEAEEAKAKETQVIMDETMAKIADEIDCKGTKVCVKKSIESVMKVTVADEKLEETIEAPIEEKEKVIDGKAL